MDDIYINFQSSPDEDTLSLRDFAVTPQNMLQRQDHHHRRSSSQPSSEFFEFFTDFANSEKFMSHAEDIIFCGKLIPFKQNYQLHEEEDKEKQRRNRRRRSESMSELQSTNNYSAAAASVAMRTSRSLDDKKLTRKTSFDRASRPETINRTNSGKLKAPKPPRWLVLMFGSFKFLPPQMDLQDMKSRQVRRTGSTTLLAGRDVMPANRIHRKSSSLISNKKERSWAILDVLGCQGTGSVAVTTSLSF